MYFRKPALKNKLYLLSVAQKILDKCFALLEAQDSSEETRDNIINSLAKLLNVQKTLIEQEKELKKMALEENTKKNNYKPLSKEEIDLLRRFLVRN